MMKSFLQHRVVVPDGVVIQQVSGEAIILNLNTEHYYGLDDVGTRMWELLTTSSSIGEAASQLLDEYDVGETTLHHDLQQLISVLEKNGLLKVEESH